MMLGWRGEIFMLERKQMVKMSDIAEEAGVSIVTVSNALSGKKGVSDEMRAEIQKIAEKLGYEPHLKGKKQNQIQKIHYIGVLISERYVVQANSFYMEIYRKIVAAGQEKQLFCCLEILKTSAELEMQMPDLLGNTMLEGIIVIGGIKPPYIKKLKKSAKISFVCVDFLENIPDVDFIISDGYQGTFLLTEQLISMGHKDIAFVGTIRATTSINDRYMGFQKAMLQAGISVRKEWVIPDRKMYDLNVEVEIPFQLWKDSDCDMPTAYVCNCDLTAAMLIEKLEERGFSVPEDVSVTGFDHYLLPEMKGKKLTTYSVNIEKMAEESVKKIWKAIENSEEKKGLKILSGELIEGETIRAIKPY